MTKIQRIKPVILISLMMLLSATTQLVADNDNTKPLVSVKLLTAAKVDLLWQNKLPMRKNESLEELFILDNQILALSSLNYLVSLNRENGKVIFSRPVAGIGLPVIGVDIYEGEIFTIAGNNLIEINPKFGDDADFNRLKFNAACPAVRNNSNYYIGAKDKLLHALRAEDKTQVFEASARNNSTITSVVADDKFVIFATNKGNCISIPADSREHKWQFDAADAIVAPVVRDNGTLFLASRDSNLYKIDILTGELIWKYQSGAVLEKSPKVTKELVYQYARNKGVIALDKKSSSVLWQLPQGVDLLAESNQKAYLITKHRTLVVMDNKQNRRIYSVNFASVSRYTTNLADSKIYIAAEDGRIACIKPIE